MRIFLLVFLLTPVFGQTSGWPKRGCVIENSTGNSATPQAYQGCIVRSGGKIMLIDAQNRDYILVSSSQPLENYVGQEVRLSAISMKASEPASDQDGTNPQRAPGRLLTLDVENIQKLAEKCSSPESTDKK